MSSSTAVTTTCYRPYPNGTIESFYSTFYTPKTNSNYSPCCFSSAAYAEDNICYQENHSQGTGYYVALCTDPTYKDPSCSQSCVSYTKGDVVYVGNSWYCCGADSQGDPNCSNPTTETVNGIPAPSVLQAVLSGSPTSSSSSSSSSSSATSGVTSTATSSSQSQATSSPSGQTQSTSSTSNGLSTGAKAGIGAGIAVLAIILIAIAAFFYIRRSRRSHGADVPATIEKTNLTGLHKYHGEMDSSVPPPYRNEGGKPGSVSAQPVELMSPPSQQQQRVHEMG